MKQHSPKLGKVRDNAGQGRAKIQTQGLSGSVPLPCPSNPACTLRGDVRWLESCVTFDLFHVTGTTSPLSLTPNLLGKVLYMPCILVGLSQRMGSNPAA